MENLLAAVPIAPIAMFVGILVLMVVMVIWSARKMRENLTRLAGDLGLNLREKPPVLGLFRSMPKVDGEWRGRRVRFFLFSTGSGKRRQTWSAVGVGCHNPHDLKLRLCGQNILTEFAERFGLQDLRLGLHPFDDKFVVQTNAPEFLRAALLPEIQEPLLKHWPVALGQTNLKIEGNEVVYAESGSFTDEKMLQRMKSLLDTLVALAAVAEVYSA